MSAKQPATEFIGKAFNNLTIIEDLGYPKTSNHRMVIAKCVCGKTNQYFLGNIKSGKSLSCGCIQNKFKKHGLNTHALYRRYYSMLDRCYNANCKTYNRYGGRGITVCDEWKNNFQAFYDWAISTGWSKELAIDRVNNDGNYEPSNCRWATDKMECRNRSSNKIIEFNNNKKCVAEWCEIYNVTQHVFYNRRRNGWSIEEALTTPPMKNQFVFK